MSTEIRDRVLSAARARVEEIAASEAFERQRRGVQLIDVREDVETAAGSPQGALRLPRSMLELRIGELGLAPHAPLALICAGGARSMLCAHTLLQLGFTEVASVAGGFDAWKAAGLPVARSAVDPDWAERYSRHLKLGEIGAAGQQRLQQSRILVIGAGGLGSPALLYLAAAGVGTLRIVDDDRVERSNLQRQVIHADARIGMLKTESARMSLLALNPRLQIETVSERITADNVDALFDAVDVVIDGSDNLATRYCVSDACVRLAKPMVFAAVHRFEGQVAVFDAGRRRGDAPCYRCLFPQAPAPEFAPNCSDIGVLGITPGIFGLLQANEAIKLLLGIGRGLVGSLLSVDLLNLSFRETRLRPDPECPACGAAPRGELLQPVAALCASDPAS